MFEQSSNVLHASREENVALKREVLNQDVFNKHLCVKDLVLSTTPSQTAGVTRPNEEDLKENICLALRIKGSLMKQRNWLRHAKFGLYVIGLIIFLEVSSAIVLNNLISSERLRRLDTLFLKEIDYGFTPHPYLDWVEPLYLKEQKRYLNCFGKNRTDEIYIVALGGSTTRTGYPAFTERYINDELKGLNLSFRVVVFNFGVNGWTSTHSLQNYFYLLRYLHPEFVVFHHNTNDRYIKEDAFQQSVLQFPLVSQTERVLLMSSKFYKLLKFTYLSSYNPIHYGESVVSSDELELPMPARISSYLNDKESGAWMLNFFRIGFSPGKVWPIGSTINKSREFILTETYESFIKYTRADNSTLVLTTQYQNYSKQADEDLDERGRREEDWVRYHSSMSDSINNLLINISEKYINIQLVDLNSEMEQYDHLLSEDGVHFVSEGIELKGELIGKAIFDILAERYNLME